MCEWHSAAVTHGSGEAGVSCHINRRKTVATATALPLLPTDLPLLPVEPPRSEVAMVAESRGNLSNAVSSLRRQLGVAPGGRFIFTIATIDALPLTLNLVLSARHWGGSVGVVTLFAQECSMLRGAGVACAASGLLPNYKGDLGRTYAGDGYKLTFAKFEICAIAIEMGMQPTSAG